MPAEWLQLLTILLPSGGVLGGLLLWRQDRRRAPIEYATAQVADAVAVSNAATALVKTVNDRMTAQDVKIAQQDTKIERQDGQIVELRDNNSKLQGQVSGWLFWYNDLTDDWEIHRTQLAPPPPPA